MADVSLDEVIRRRGINTKPPIKRYADCSQLLNCVSEKFLKHFVEVWKEQQLNIVVFFLIVTYGRMLK